MMTDDGKFHLGYLEGREWAANWAGEEVLQRLATTGPPALDGGATGRDGDGALESVTTLILSRPLPAPEIKAFWESALPDADAAMLHDLQFLSGFLAGTRCIAQEPV